MDIFKLAIYIVMSTKWVVNTAKSHVLYNATLTELRRHPWLFYGSNKAY